MSLAEEEADIFMVTLEALCFCVQMEEFLLACIPDMDQNPFWTLLLYHFAIHLELLS
jgi:hypothetical protein